MLKITHPNGACTEYVKHDDGTVTVHWRDVSDALTAEELFDEIVGALAAGARIDVVAHVVGDDEHTHAALSERCQQVGCDQPSETACPLCAQLLCLAHDPLVPSRRHACLSGPAEED